MAKEDPDDLEDGPRPVSVDERNLHKLDKIIVDTNTGYLEYFHTASQYAKPPGTDTTWLNEAIHGTYREGLIDAMGGDIYALQKKQTWSIVTQ